jgi:tRNA (guanine37-N1)-methyltransferase
MRLTMDFHVMTLFPEMVSQGLSTSILGRAMEKNLISLECINIRDYSADQKHHKVDDYTYGGGAGMLMQAQPVYDCYKSLESRIDPQHTKRVIYVTPQGSVFNQQMAMEFAKSDDLIFLCGHYEGIDERVLEEIVTDYVSIGDYVLTGGELPAMVMIDTISRLVPGVLNNDISAETESFTDGLLEYPQYSRPEEWMGKKVPPILLSGDHKKVDEWRLMMSLERTKERRPELYEAWMAAHPPKPPKRRRKRRKNTTAVEGTADTTIDSIKVNNADNVEVVQNSGNTNFEDVSSNDLGK